MIESNGGPNSKPSREAISKTISIKSTSYETRWLIASKYTNLLVTFVSRPIFRDEDEDEDVEGIPVFYTLHITQHYTQLYTFFFFFFLVSVS